MAPEMTILAALQRPWWNEEDLRRQLMHEQPLLTATEIDRLLAGMPKDQQPQYINLKSIRYDAS